MENQPIDQNSSNPASPEQAVQEQSSTNTTPYIIGVVIVIAAVVLWYVYSAQVSPVSTETPPTETQTLSTDQTTPGVTSGNTTADISADLDQIPDPSAGLDADATASASDLQSL